VKNFSSKQWIGIAAVVILLALFLVRPGVSRLKVRIASSISRAVARPVEIGSVHLRFLPQPGFDLDNLVIYEDPEFGAEPMLRAPEVAAVVRLTSLLRGRLDIARLELTEPSLNLVRRADGRWNLEALLERSERTPLAPTGKSKSEARPGFPYIEASSGRINFKAGQEKKPYALLNADFALWQESENTWGARLTAEPLRTDMNLTDTGLLRMNGTWQRAGSLRDTPLQISVAWDRAQLGQLTKLVSGNDKGWRGEVRLSAAMSGIPAALQITADTSIQDFHRYDIPSSEGLRLMAHCDARYSSAERVMHEIFCTAPVGDGMITLRGDAGLPGMQRVDLSLNVESVPVSAVGQLARRAKKNLPADLVSSGSVQGNFTVREDGTAPRTAEFRGRGEIVDLRLQSVSNKAEFALGNVPFLLSSGASSERIGAHVPAKRGSVHRFDAGNLSSMDGLHLEYGPFPVALGRPLPAQARGWVTRSGYGLTIRGEGEVSHISRLANLAGLPAVKAGAEGLAEIELQVGGSWAESVSENTAGFSSPEVTGTAQLHNVRAPVRGVNGPVEIVSADVELLPEEVRVKRLSAQAADARWTGSMALPRGCGTPGACVVRFDLNVEEMNLSEIAEWLSSQPSQRRWYQVLTSAEPATPTFLQNLRASGKVTAGRLLIHDLVANRVSGALDLDRGKLKISDLHADLLGGKHHGDWRADFTADSPAFVGSGTLTGISLQELAEAMHDSWISGTAGGTYRITASGADSAAFWESAEGALQFDLRDGVLAHISLASDEGPLRITRWQGRARLGSEKIEIEKGKLVSPTETFEISGTASLGQVLDFKVARDADVRSAHAGAAGYSITGTLAEPLVVVTTTPETQAELKP
jgi:hypothetical protein